MSTGPPPGAGHRTRLTALVRRIMGHELLGDAGILAAALYAGALVGLATTAAVARKLGPADYGRAVLVIAYPTLVWTVLGPKSMSVTVRYLARLRAGGRRDEYGGMCKLGYLLDGAAALMTLVVVAVSTVWVSNRVLHLETAWLPVAYASSFVVYSTQGTSWAILSSLRCFRLLAILQVMERGAVSAIVLPAVFAGGGVRGVALGTAGANVLTGVVMATASRRALRREGLGGWWRSPLRSVLALREELTGFFGWNYLHVTLTGAIAQLPALLLGRARGPAEAGYYRLAYSVVTVGSYAESSLVRVAYPILSARWASGDREALRATLRRWTVRAGIPVGLLLLGVIPLMPALLPAVFGRSYEPMVGGAQLMIAGAAVSVALFSLNPLYYAAGKIALWAKGYAFYTAVVVAAAVTASPRWGFPGVAAVVGLGAAAFNLAMAAMTRGIWSDERDAAPIDRR